MEPQRLNRQSWSLHGSVVGLLNVMVMKLTVPVAFLTVGMSGVLESLPVVEPLFRLWDCLI